MDDKRAFLLDSVFDIFNEENTRVMIFPFHIKPIMIYFPEVRESAPKGTVRDIMYACDEDAPIPDRSVFHNQNYYDRLYGEEENCPSISIDNFGTSDIIVYADGKMTSLSNENPLKWLTNECRNHPVYLDVSTTWCGPCRAGIKGSESLRTQFKDSDIRFAIIWIRSEKEDWLKIAPTITNAIQIYVDNAETADLIMGELGISSFPTYYTISRDGQFSRSGVPTYLSPELPPFLDRLLK